MAQSLDVDHGPKIKTSRRQSRIWNNLGLLLRNSRDAHISILQHSAGCSGAVLGGGPGATTRNTFQLCRLAPLPKFSMP